VAYASAYGDSYSTEYISDATVLLIAGDSNTYSMGYTSSGVYATNSGAVTVSGGIGYKIRIILSNGDVYESEEQELPGSIELSGLSAEIGEKTVVGEDAYGDVTTTTYSGIYINVSVNSPDAEKKYIRVENTVVEQSNYTVGLTSFPQKVWCVRYNSLSDLPIVEYTSGSDNNIDSLSMGFLKYYVDYSTQNEDASARRLAGWVVSTDVYSTSAETYEYYQKILSQINANDNIFDPIPSQITGNITCITDSSKIALGLFDVTRRIGRIDAFYWLKGMSDYKQKTLKSYHAPSASDCSDETPEYDWIDF
jgi:hypothetical protein